MHPQQRRLWSLAQEVDAESRYRLTVVQREPVTHPLFGVGCDTVPVGPRDPLLGDGLGPRG
ncbi:hypothetical protein [Chloroflexus aggregans]|uniref:Uncharacterized protein n=1 Tax=Chloroflexus aggregans (strain MD-66 / DSM 9485) TaxID=326427 RepID=B8G836_CHLAD|nr:hypothetical protein [Chloroflexus aggregans]ACL26090.1 hypothetical protein Cagg_3232 [Chloroflexus aggregans DSM 9485]